MPLLLLLVAGCGLCYFGMAHRRCDLFTLAFVSSCVYFLPGFIGSVPNGAFRDSRVPLEAETYAVMLTVLTAILAGAWCWDPARSVRGAPERASADPAASWVALAAALASLVQAIRVGGAALLSASKVEVMAVTSRWFLLLAFAASFALLLSWMQRQWAVCCLAGLLLLFTVFVGFRSNCALALIAAFLVHLHRQGAQRLFIRNRRSMLWISGIAMFFFAYKFVYTMVKLGRFDLVLQSLSDPAFYLDSIIESEPFATQMILNEVLRSGFQTDWHYIVESVVAQFTLFSGEFGLQFVGFNELFQPRLFAEVEYGLAANIWAQMLAAGGWPLFLGFLLAFVVSLRLGSLWLDSTTITTRAALALGGAYWAFYIHRNDLGYELGLLRRVVLVWLMIAVLTQALRYFHSTGRRRRTFRTTAGAISTRNAVVLLPGRECHSCSTGIEDRWMPDALCS